MTDPVYFQWQNEHLLRTIYPLREVKLRDFLVYFHEIDLWAEYKKKTDISGEVAAYLADQRRAIVEAVARYDELEKYFLREDVSDAYPNPDEATLKRIHALHKAFSQYYPKITRPDNRRYFILDRIAEFENYQREPKGKLSENLRKLRNMGPTWRRREEVEKENERLIHVIPQMLDREVGLLSDLLAAHMKLQSCRKQLAGDEQARRKSRDAASKNLESNNRESETVQEQIGALQAELARYKKTSLLADSRAYFLTADTRNAFAGLLRRSGHTGAPDQGMLREINALHKDYTQKFPKDDHPIGERFFIDEHIGKLEKLRRETKTKITGLERDLRNMGPTWKHRPARLKELAQQKDNILRMLDEELSKLHDFHWAFTQKDKPAGETTKLIREKEEEIKALGTKSSALAQKARELEASVKEFDAFLNRPEAERLVECVDSVKVTKEDLARGRSESYRNELSQKGHEALLEEVVNRFMADPEKYPVWLQYMVIHFSGMRYQSAHGSWADPKDLLLALRIRDVESELSEPARASAISDDRLRVYGPKRAVSPGDRTPGGSRRKLPRLAEATDLRWKEKVEQHLKRLQPENVYGRYRALMDLRIDEENYEIETMSPEDALEELRDMKDRLPEWMWKEIVRMTDLRLTEVSGPNWEEPSPEDLEARYSYKMGEFRTILDDWKKAHLTGWREEHDRGNRLIVTRAVCNEVAEHIQHLRGHSPPGGLTAKPEWYLRMERNGSGADKPYLTKALREADFTPGASILWLSWVHGQPNIWRIARPLTLKNGEGLLPAQAGAKEFDNAFTRESGEGTQWLRWLHEATVAAVGETVDGTTVLTFETALPIDDKRQSTIGIFKRTLAGLSYAVSDRHFNGTFVGYVPEGAIPFEDIEAMLDWNAIMRRKAFTQAQLDAYWGKVRKKHGAGLRTGLRKIPEKLSPVEAAPVSRVANAAEWMQCYEVDPARKTAEPCKPKVALKRGMRLYVDKAGAVQAGNETYLPVYRSDMETRAEGVWVKAGEVIDAPEGRADRPVEAVGQITLQKIGGGSSQGRPVPAASGVRLQPGTVLRVSAVHKMSPADKGDGGIDCGGGRTCHVVVACPGRSEAVGLLVGKDEVKAIEEAAYERAI